MHSPESTENTMNPTNSTEQQEEACSTTTQIDSRQPEQMEDNQSPLSLEEEIINLQQQIIDAEKKQQDFFEKYLASEAEMQNLRRRTERDLSNAHKYALEKFVAELLPVVDSLELAMQALDQDHSLAENQAVHQFKAGNEMTHKMFVKALEKFGVKQVSALGEKLNPDFHQALSMQPTHEHESNTIIQVIQKGYLLNDRLVRPALVIVAQ